MQLCSNNHLEICFEAYDLEGEEIECPLCIDKLILRDRITELEKEVMKLEKMVDDLRA